MNSLDIIFLIISSLGIVQGILLITALLNTKQSERKSNRYIAATIFFMIYLILEFLLLRRTFSFELPFYYSSRYGIWLLIGPLLLTYTYSLIDTSYQLKSKILHFLPFLIFSVIIPLLLGGYLIHKHSASYGMLTLLTREFDYVSGFNYLYSVIFIFQFVHAIFYLVMILRVIKTYLTRIKLSHSNIDLINFEWLRRLIIAFIGIIALTLIFFALIANGSYYNRSVDYVYMLPLLIVIYWIAYKTLNQPSLFSDIIDVNELSQKYKDSTLSHEQSITYKEVLLNHMQNQKPYQNSELKLNDLAETLNISPRHLSQLINEQFKINFYDFINQYRIEDAKSLLQHKKEYNILEIAFEVGFNNKTSFNNYFKKLLKMTPTEYRENFSN